MSDVSKPMRADPCETRTAKELGERGRPWPCPQACRRRPASFARRRNDDLDLVRLLQRASRGNNIGSWMRGVETNAMGTTGK